MMQGEAGNVLFKIWSGLTGGLDLTEDHSAQLYVL